MKIIPESSVKLYDAMAANPPKAPNVPVKTPRKNHYVSNGKSIVAVVRSDSRSTAISEALRLLGGLEPIVKDYSGTFLLKPNCNTDDPFPASVHSETVKNVAKTLIKQGIASENIVIGDMSGKARGLPTKLTMENIGLQRIARDLGLRLSFFEEEDWVTVNHSKMTHWPEGVRIPRPLYDANRVISLPTMKTHVSATFTLSLKNAVGVIDPFCRNWLHNGQALNEKIAELNLAYSADLVVLDGLNCFTTRGPSDGDLAHSGVVIAGGDRVAVDTLGVAVLKQFQAVNIVDRSITNHPQLKWAEKLGLGCTSLNKIEIRASNLENDPTFLPFLASLQKE